MSDKSKIEWTDATWNPVRGCTKISPGCKHCYAEVVADLKRATFQMKKPSGEVIKTYKLSRKTILNIVGVVKLILGKKVWMTWDLDLGQTERSRQRYFTEEQLQKIIGAAEGQNRVLFALLAGTGMRIGEAAGLHIDDLDLDNCVIYVRRGVWNGRELPPKTKNAVREIDIDSGLAELLRQHLKCKKGVRVFEARNGSPISGNNILKRVLYPLLERLGIPKAGLHAFRHSRVTILRPERHARGFAEAMDWSFLFAYNG